MKQDRILASARARGAGSLTRRMIGVAAIWIVVLLGVGGFALTLAAVAQGIQIHRVHDVAGIRQGLTLWQAAQEGSRQAAQDIAWQAAQEQPGSRQATERGYEA